MEARELRIGNWVNVKHPHEKEINPYEMEVKGITNEEVLTDAYGCYYGTCDALLSSISPIPITDQWLVNLGFTGLDFELYTLMPSGDFIYLCEDGFIKISKKIKYVHQLQNLYYALTGQELTLKK